MPLDGDTRPLVERFYGRIARAALTDLEVDYGGLDVDGLQPATLPDLFAGQTLALSGRYHGSGTGEVVVRGRLGRQRFERRLRVVLPEREAEHPELGTLWARRRIDTLMSRMLLQEQEPLVQEVTRLALAFRLASRYTSFVATDNQVVSQSGDPMLVPQAVEMPLGVSYEGVFGRGSETRKGAMVRTSSAGVLGLPAESVTEAVALNAGSLVAGGQLHVRGGRADTKSSDVTHVTTDKEVNLSPARVTADRKALSLPVAGDPEGAIPSPLAVTTPIEATMVAAPGRVLLGERPSFRITVRNASHEQVQVPETLLWTDLTFEVRLNGGPARPSTCFEHRTARTVTLLPGESREYVLQLSEAPVAALLGSTGKFEIQLLQFCGGSLTGQPARCEIRID